MQGFGDAKLVSSNSVESYENKIESGALVENDDEYLLSNNDKKDENVTPTFSNEENVKKNDNTIENNSDDEYYTKSKLERDLMFSQMLENYQKILENNQISEDQKSIAQTEIKRINDLKNSIMICENLIKTKGFDDVIIFVNDKSINVIVKKEKLDSMEIAQIQNIVERELKSSIDDIHISTK